MKRLAVCPSCGRRLSRRYAFFEKAFRCPGCGGLIRADGRSLGMSLGVGLFLLGIGFYVAFLLGYVAYWEFAIVAVVVLTFFVLVFPYVQGFVEAPRGPDD
jgi:predicted RNA-binding Zn-ribbon protein involved in translation (DUF1610 family)